MKLGFGLYRGSLTDENLRFARQCGAEGLVVHLVDYFKGQNPELSSGDQMGWGYAGDPGKLWEVDELLEIKEKIESYGLSWEAIENFDPAHWHDILLDGPQKHEQVDKLKQIVRNIGRAGIPVMGYNFSMAGVWGWSKAPTGRGGAMQVGYDETKIDPQTPIPKGMIWNMIYDKDAPEGHQPPVSDEQLWDRLGWFLREIIPVAEEAGVRMALHPDDPPVDRLRNTARLVNEPHKYERVMQLADSPANTIEFCMGSIQEMRTGSVYEALETYLPRDKVAYVHFRNVKGKVPDYREVFVDEGDIDMHRALRIMKEHGYKGLLIPDHTPEMSCNAPWHAGMAYAMGYMKAAMQAAGI